MLEPISKVCVSLYLFVFGFEAPRTEGLPSTLIRLARTFFFLWRGRWPHREKQRELGLRFILLLPASEGLLDHHERIQQETQHKKNANTNNNNNKKHYYCSIFAPVARLVLLPFLLRHKNNSLGLHYSVAPSPFRVNNNNKKTSSSKKNLYGHQQDSFSARTPKAYGWQLPLRADVLWNAKQNNCTCTSLVPPCLSCFSFRSSSPSPKTNQILYHSQRLKSNRYTAPHEIVEVIVQTLTTSPSRRSSDLLLLELFDLYPFITPAPSPIPLSIIS
eukprot:gene864-497_t